jgi:hypothetical protein
MFIDTKPSTTPRPLRSVRTRVGRVLSPRRQGHPSTVVRVSLSAYRSKLYAYRCDGTARVGDMVRVVTPLKGPMVVPVVALGRGGYMGPLKRAELI